MTGKPSVLDKIIKFSSLSVIPVLGFIGAFMFNKLDTIRTAQSDWIAHIKVIEQTLPYINDGVKRDGIRLDAMENNMMQRAGEPAVDSTARAKADARRDAQIKALQDRIKELTAKEPEQHSENDRSLVDAQNQLARLILN